MSWQLVTKGGEEVIVGHIGDPLAIEVTFAFAWEADEDPIDFSDHTWLCQVRKTVAATEAMTLEQVGDPTVTVDLDARTSTVTVLFSLEDTSGFVDSVIHVYGVRAVEGTYAPWTGIAADKIVGYTVVPRPEVTP